MLARLGPTDQGGGTHTVGGGVSSRGRGEASSGRPLWALPAVTEPHDLAATVGLVGGSAGLSASGVYRPSLPHAGLGLFDHVVGGGVVAFMIDAVWAKRSPTVTVTVPSLGPLFPSCSTATVTDAVVEGKFAGR